MVFAVSMRPVFEKNSRSQPVIAPVELVVNLTSTELELLLSIVWTPSENENASGVTDVKPGPKFGPSALISSTNPVTLSLVVKGPLTLVNGVPL